MATTKIRGNTQIIAGTITDAEINASAGIQLTKLSEPVLQADGGQTFTGDQNAGGFKITNLGTPTAAGDAATKAYTDALSNGLSWKGSVRVASTANIDLSVAADPNPIDGVTLTDGQYILLKSQTAPAENGIYVAVTATDPTTWTRRSDMSTWAEVPAAAVFVEEGTANADSGWVCTSDQGGTLGTTAITFVQFNGAGSITAGTGLTKTGNTINANAADTSITMNADDFAVNNNTTGGIETSTGIRIKLDSTTDGYATISTGANGARVVSIKDANVASDAAIAFSKLAALTSTKILVGSAGNVATAVNMSGDATISNTGVVTVSASFLKATNFVTREVPTGAINSSNVTFTLANTPVAGTETVYLNGLEQNVGGGADYTIAGATITYNAAPTTGDTLVVSYIK